MTLATIGAPGWGSNGSVSGVRWSPLQPRLCQSWSWQRRPDAKVATPQGNRPFYRWLTRDSRALFPHLPERTRLFRLCTTPHDWTQAFLAAPTVLGVIDTYGIELVHPMREGRSSQQIGRKGLSNHRWIVGAQL